MFAKSFGDLGEILEAFSGGCLGKSQKKVCKVLERFDPHSGGALGDCLADRSGVLANSLDICWDIGNFLGRSWPHLGGELSTGSLGSPCIDLPKSLWGRLPLRVLGESCRILRVGEGGGRVLK